MGSVTYCMKTEWFKHFLMSCFIIFAMFYLCIVDYFLIELFWRGAASLASLEEKPLHYRLQGGWVFWLWLFIFEWSITLRQVEKEQTELWNRSQQNSWTLSRTHTNPKRKLQIIFHLSLPVYRQWYNTFCCWDLSVWDRSKQPMTAPLISLLPKHSALTAALSSFLRFPTIHILICHSHST